MADVPNGSMLEFLRWVAGRRRTYEDAMEAWRSNCPRLSTWEDAWVDGLVRLEREDERRESVVVLTGRGRDTLAARPE